MYLKNFKNWLSERRSRQERLSEIVDPRPPSGQVTLDDGLGWKHFQWTTALGNRVSLGFAYIDTDQKGTHYKVQFSVNDSLKDNASKTDQSIRDPEILPSVLHVLVQKSNEMKIAKISFSAYKKQSDEINRRAIIYKKIIDRYFSNDWNVAINGSQFILTRKNQI